MHEICEGADGFGPLTLQAALKDWSESHPADPISLDWLDKHLHLVENAPQIMDGADLDALAEEHRSWVPNLVFIDTLGSAAAGQNLSAIEAGTAIGRNMRAFCRDLKADCWLVHHLGKNETLGPTEPVFPHRSRYRARTETQPRPGSAHRHGRKEPLGQEAP